MLSSFMDSEGRNVRRELGRFPFRRVPPAITAAIPSTAPGAWPLKERGSNRSSCENLSNWDKNSHGLPYPLFPMGLDMFVCSALKLRAFPQTLN